MFESVGTFRVVSLACCMLFLSLSACDDKQSTPNTNSHLEQKAEDFPPPAWYDSRGLDVSLVHQKQTIELDAQTALKILPPFGQPVDTGWQTHLPEQVTDAQHVFEIIDESILVKEPKPLLVMILGFSKDNVHVVLARHVANYLWHWEHSVEADLKIQRSPEVDQRLHLTEFTKPFTRTIDSVNYGDQPEYVHQILGPPDATRQTQAGGLFWEYYFDRNLTIQYQGQVYNITDGVPEEIRNGTQNNPPYLYYNKDQ